MIASSFGQEIAAWHDFYLMLGTAAVTLLGLLFVAVSLNLRVLTADDHAALRARAVLTFNSFLYIFTFAVLFLIPNQSPAGLGLPLLGIGGLGAYTLTRSLLRIAAAPDPGHPREPGFLLWRIVLPIAWNIVLLSVSVTVVMGSTTWLYWLVPVFLARLTSAVRNAWDLLLHVGHEAEEAETERATPATDAGPAPGLIEEAIGAGSPAYARAISE